MDASLLLAVLKRELEGIRAEYVSSGRGDDFDAYVNHLLAERRWPFDGSPLAPGALSPRLNQWP